MSFQSDMKRWDEKTVDMKLTGLQLRILFSAMIKSEGDLNWIQANGHATEFRLLMHAIEKEYQNLEKGDV